LLLAPLAAKSLPVSSTARALPTTLPRVRAAICAAAVVVPDSNILRLSAKLPITGMSFDVPTCVRNGGVNTVVAAIIVADLPSLTRAICSKICF
jgi:hypothetical protein